MKNEIKQLNRGKQPYQQDRIYGSDGIVPALCSGLSDLLITPPVKIGASRGRGSIGDTKQQLEMREDENTNTVTGVQKDNLVIQQKILAPNNRNHVAGDFNTRERYETDIVPSLQAYPGGTQQSYLKQSNTHIRRLTEIECERLQGFPDDWTAFGNYEGIIKKIPKTQRYKLMGNAVMVDMVQAVAERIKII